MYNECVFHKKKQSLINIYYYFISYDTKVENMYVSQYY